jgi:hypothetical protein
MIPEDCKLIAHNTGDGWYLGVVDKDGDDIAILYWPYDDQSKSAKELEAYGFEII